MSVKVLVYVPSLNALLLPEIASRFAQLGMQFETHPSFAMDQAGSSKVPAKLRIDSAEVAHYQNVDMQSEFEIAYKDFRYGSPLSVRPAINEKLKTCTKVVTIRMNATHTNSLRVGLYFAAFLAECTNGIVYAPRSDDYLEPAEAVEGFAQEVTSYEKVLPPEDWKVSTFESWSAY
jgi:hypothetical protein